MQTLKNGLAAPPCVAIHLELKCKKKCLSVKLCFFTKSSAMIFVKKSQQKFKNLQFSSSFAQIWKTSVHSSRPRQVFNLVPLDISCQETKPKKLIVASRILCGAWQKLWISLLFLSCESKQTSFSSEHGTVALSMIFY